MYRAVLFDLDGTLTDSKEGIFDGLRRAFAKRGTAYPDDFLKKFLGPPFLTSLQEIAGFSEEEAAEILKEYRAYYKAVGVYKNAVVEGVIRLLGRLKAKGVRLAVATSKPERESLKVLDRFSLTGYFDAAAGALDDGKEGTKAAVVRRALRLLNVPEDEKKFAVLVGDRKYDVEGAKENGIDAVGFTRTGYAEAGELEAAGAVFVTDEIDKLYAFLTGGIV